MQTSRSSGMFDPSVLPVPDGFFRSNVEKFRPIGGHRAIGLCPFHKDKNPSLSIDLDRGLWHCFTCNMGGDIIRFIETRDRLSFKEAAKSVGAWRSEGLSESERHRITAEQRQRQRELEQQVAQQEAERQQRIEARDWLHQLEQLYTEAKAVHYLDGTADLIPMLRRAEQDYWQLCGLETRHDC